MSIELDGNGNTVRSSPVVADSDLSKQIRSAGQADLIKEVEALRDELTGIMRHLSMSAGDQAREERMSLKRSNRSDVYIGQEQAYSHSSDIVDEKFSALLLKIKN